MKPTILKRAALCAAMLLALIGGSLVSAQPAGANGSGCRIINAQSYACTTVAGSGTFVRTASVSYATTNLICGSSAFMYVISPNGRVSGLGYQARNNCVAGRGYFTFGLNRHFTSGSLICGKFMIFGNSVGPEPCVRIR